MSAEDPGGKGGTFAAEDQAGILAEIALIARAAMNRRKVLVDRSGEHDVPDSDERTALSCVELKAKLLGLLGDGKNMSREAFEKLVNDAGFDLVPRAKKLRSVGGGK